MKVILVIEGRLAGMNEYTAANRRNHYAGAEMKKRQQDICRVQIHHQLRGVHFSNPVHITYRWYEKNRRRDLDNIAGFGHKVIQDALVKSGVLNDDGWNNVVGFTDLFFVDKDRPRIEIELEEI